MRHKLTFVFSMLFATYAHAGTATVAVAANFAEVMEQLQPAFEAASGHTLRITNGSTGALYAQIKSGAPFDILLAADQRRPALLEREGFGVAGSRFTYAIGKLTLWSPKPGIVREDIAAVLRDSSVQKCAIANPRVAPYGLAARQALEALGLWESISAKLVMGENIGQTYTMVATGNAEAGFIALSYVMSPRNKQAGSRWDIPDELYEPIRQDAVLLRRGASNDAATAFMSFLTEPSTLRAIEQFGYGVEAHDYDAARAAVVLTGAAKPRSEKISEVLRLRSGRLRVVLTGAAKPRSEKISEVLRLRSGRTVKKKSPDRFRNRGFQINA